MPADPASAARLSAQIENAAARFTPYWPLRSFIAANPLQGLEAQSFEQAVETGARLFGGRGYPDRATVARAFAAGKIDGDILTRVATRHGRAEPPEAPLVDAIEPEATSLQSVGIETRPPAAVDRVLVKWLSAFLDEGQAAWPMPHRDLGFWRAVKRVARHDPDLPQPRALDGLPEDALAALDQMLAAVPDPAREERLVTALAALPGWTGYIKWRAGESGHPWRKAAPITLADLLAVRFAFAAQLGEGPSRAAALAAPWPDAPIWLEAWEESYRRRLGEALRSTATRPVEARPSTEQVDAQLIFCIDVRSEVLRRHLERSGPYETIGFAGFFGAPVAVRPFGAPGAYASCPVLLTPKHVIPDVPAPGSEAAAAAHLAGQRRLSGAKGLLRALKDSVAGAYAFVEATGALFGAAMVARTVAPAGVQHAVARLRDRVLPQVRLVPRVDLQPCGHGHGHDHGHDHAHGHAHGVHGASTGPGDGAGEPTGEPSGLSLTEQVFFAEGALSIMGLTRDFAPLVVLTGHGGQTANNPFEAGLDCGACGGNRGGPNARIMAAILNGPAVRAQLARHGIAIPNDTLFLAGEHNTTTDTVTLFDTDAAAARHPDRLARLQTALEAARRGAVAERCRHFPGAAPTLDEVESRAADWAQVRPEWALARNAAFIVGPRSLTRPLDLEGRTFLHSYDWRQDGAGKALEVILTAPMVVAEWINTQYYFSTVDNAVYGAGSKVTHNVVAGVGVVQGNGGDLMTGLPAQSVMAGAGVPYHEPLRLMTVVHAPVQRVSDIIRRNGILQTLFDNGWVALLVIDPETGQFLRRNRDGTWIATEPEGVPVTAPDAPAASAVVARTDRASDSHTQRRVPAPAD